jgi:hypothetical protein
VRALEAAVERLAARAGDGEPITVEAARREISECERRGAMMRDSRSSGMAQADCEIHCDSPGEPATVSNGI